MPRPVALRLVGPVSDDQVVEIAHARVLLEATAHLGEVVRVYRPQAPVVVFSRRDTRAAGYAAAVAAAHAAGFQVAVRAVGGRAVAYTEESVVVDHVAVEPDAVAGHDARFRDLGAHLAACLRTLGVDARLGPVPGEYCPGAHSVNARGVSKLVGTAQRVRRDSWLFAALVMVDDADRVRPVLTEVYAVLGQEFDPRSVGSLAREVPGLTAAQVQEALLASYAGPLARASELTDLVRAASDLRDQHRP